MSDQTTYEKLAAPFEHTFFRDGGGNTKLEYIDGEQCLTRLNTALGAGQWSFRIVEHGIHAEADECWVLGELTAIIDGDAVIKQQFGSQKVKRSRSSGIPLDIGFDLKGAATDCIKKCASLIGVALYLYEKDAPQQLGSGRPTAEPTGTEQQRAAAMAGITTNTSGDPVCLLDIGDRMCGRNVSGWEARGDYPARTPAQVAEWQIKRAEFGMPLCIGHQKAIKDGKVKAVRWQAPSPALRVVGDDEPPVRPDDDELPF